MAYGIFVKSSDGPEAKAAREAASQKTQEQQDIDNMRLMGATNPMTGKPAPAADAISTADTVVPVKKTGKVKKICRFSAFFFCLLPFPFSLLPFAFVLVLVAVVDDRGWRWCEAGWLNG